MLVYTAMKNDDALATILLASQIASDGATPLTTRQLWNLVEQIGEPGRLLGMTEEDLVDSGMGTDMAIRVVGLLARATAMAFELEHLDQSGIATLTPFDPAYPQRFCTTLGPNAPPILHAAGALELLNEGSVGVVGSRNVSEEGAKVAAALGRQAASLGVPLISGAARGVDQLAMNAAFEAGGTVISIPAHSLSRTLKSPGLRRAVHTGRTVVCSPYTPDSPFSVGQAMGRNKLIYALSQPWQSPPTGLRRHLVWCHGGHARPLLPGSRLASPRRRRRKQASRRHRRDPHHRRIPLGDILGGCQSDIEESSRPEQVALF